MFPELDMFSVPEEVDWIENDKAVQLSIIASQLRNVQTELHYLNDTIYRLPRRLWQERPPPWFVRCWRRGLFFLSMKYAKLRWWLRERRDRRRPVEGCLPQLPRQKPQRFKARWE